MIHHPNPHIRLLGHFILSTLFGTWSQNWRVQTIPHWKPSGWFVWEIWLLILIGSPVFQWFDWYWLILAGIGWYWSLEVVWLTLPPVQLSYQCLFHTWPPVLYWRPASPTDCLWFDFLAVLTWALLLLQTRVDVVGHQPADACSTSTVWLLSTAPPPPPSCPSSSPWLQPKCCLAQLGAWMNSKSTTPLPPPAPGVGLHCPTMELQLEARHRIAASSHHLRCSIFLPGRQNLFARTTQFLTLVFALFTFAGGKQWYISEQGKFTTQADSYLKAVSCKDTTTH